MSFLGAQNSIALGVQGIIAIDTGTGAPAVVTDPYWANVSMLLHGDGTNAAQNNTFLDGSTNNFTVTRNGNTTQGSFNPFVSTYPYAVATNGGSGYFDGTGDYLSVPAAAPLTIPTGSFTIEMWIYRSGNGSGGSSNYDSLMGSNLGMSSVFGIYVNRTTLAIGFYGNATLVETTTSISNNVWTHIAVSRTSGNNLQIFINGVSGYSASNVTAGAFTNPLYVGYDGVAANYLYYGYISNLRYLTGTTLYTTTFTPPTAPLTAVTNTALLLGMSNGAIFDNTMLNNLETVANAQISTSVFKYGTGALKFNGTTDYLPTPTKTAFVLGSGDFTIECWVYSGLVGNGGIAGQIDAASTPSLTSFYMLQIGTALTCTVSSGSTNYNATATLTANAWNHVAFVRDGATLRAYVGGVQGGTGSITTLSVNTSTYPVTVGRLGDAALYFNGYIDDFRFTKGICRYPSGTTFTPPTAAFPNS